MCVAVAAVFVCGGCRVCCGGCRVLRWLPCVCCGGCRVCVAVAAVCVIALFITCRTNYCDVVAGKLITNQGLAFTRHPLEQVNRYVIT